MLTDTATLRAMFPRGLAQPKAYHAAVDTLLLAAATARFLPKSCTHVAELGCGCGIALLGLALLRPILGVGFDREEESLVLARKNARALDLPLTFHCGEIGDARAFALFHGKQDAVIANPPYYEPGEGRPSRDCVRNRALRGEGSLSIFTQEAARLLRPYAYFVCIYPAQKLQRLLLALHEARLGLRRLQPTTAFADRPAKRVLVLARALAADDCVLDPPLVLASRGDTRQWSDAARTFCPWLTNG